MLAEYCGCADLITPLDFLRHKVVTATPSFCRYYDADFAMPLMPAWLRRRFVTLHVVAAADYVSNNILHLH